MSSIDKAIDILANQIKYMIEKSVQNLGYDKTFKSVVLAKNENNTYQIQHLGQFYNIPNALGTELNVGQCIWVKIPHGTFREMHICGIINPKSKT